MQDCLLPALLWLEFEYEKISSGLFHTVGYINKQLRNWPNSNSEPRGRHWKYQHTSFREGFFPVYNIETQNICIEGVPDNSG